MSKVFLSKQVQYRSTALIIQYAQFRTTYGEASSHQMSAYGTVLEITVVTVHAMTRPGMHVKDQMD